MASLDDSVTRRHITNICRLMPVRIPSEKKSHLSVSTSTSDGFSVPSESTTITGGLRRVLQAILRRADMLVSDGTSSYEWRRRVSEGLSKGVGALNPWRSIASEVDPMSHKRLARGFRLVCRSAH